jgi:hypothetical protein
VREGQLDCATLTTHQFHYRYTRSERISEIGERPSLTVGLLTPLAFSSQYYPCVLEN